MTKAPRSSGGGRAGGGRDDAPDQPDLPFDAPPPPKPRQRTGTGASGKTAPKPKSATRPKASGKAPAGKKAAAARKPATGKARPTARPAPTGFGGWLWLLAIGQLLVTARMIDTLMKMTALVGSPVWLEHRGLVIADLGLYGAAFLLQLVVLAAMALRKKVFVPLFIGSAIAYFLIGRIEPLLAIVFLGMDPARLVSRAVLLPMAAELGIGLVWGAYVLMSRRVKATFVR